VGGGGNAGLPKGVNVLFKGKRTGPAFKTKFVVSLAVSQMGLKEGDLFRTGSENEGTEVRTKFRSGSCRSDFNNDGGPGNGTYNVGRKETSAVSRKRGEGVCEEESFATCNI